MKCPECGLTIKEIPGECCAAKAAGQGSSAGDGYGLGELWPGFCQTRPKSLGLISRGDERVP